MKSITLIFSVIIATAVFAKTEQTPYNAKGFHVCVFDKPNILKNYGSKIIVGYVVDPATQRWRAVCDPDNTWIKGYLDFGNKWDEVRSDGENNPGELKILKPVTIAFANFKEGSVQISFLYSPIFHVVQDDAPKIGSPFKR